MINYVLSTATTPLQRNERRDEVWGHLHLLQTKIRQQCFTSVLRRTYLGFFSGQLLAVCVTHELEGGPVWQPSTSYPVNARRR